ncbi:hypothetical protein L248_1232 [Schleiferilactobacillus shenzhenensis LY-73]|uniref:Uncharacterized protein n=1 Tax=Schleiferilactobacillus shenzhenensis LY-73 TaxID=1231336 RepID=U4TRQ7_9LACO|nr:hypothetical protein L248_1232 [Schleiferilactobacillus shenzhenensis LY-73]
MKHTAITQPTGWGMAVSVLKHRFLVYAELYANRYGRKQNSLVSAESVHAFMVPPARFFFYNGLVEGVHR